MSFLSDRSLSLVNSKAEDMACSLLLATVQVLLSSQEPPQKATGARAESRAAITIVVEPKTSRPFDWRRGDRVTVGARLISTSGTRVIGVATDVELIATKSHENRVEMILRTTPENKERILRAAQISEFWFEVMPFRTEHIETLKKDVPVDVLLKSDRSYRPANTDDWGFGVKGDRLRPPSADELPEREKKTN